MTKMSPDVGRARAQIRALLGDDIKLVPSESGHFLEAEIAVADERMVRLAANSLKNVRNGTPLFALQEMGGWASAEMVRRYAHLAADHLAPYAERLCAVAVVEEKIHDTFTAQT
jgi:hypothetical protein